MKKKDFLNTNDTMLTKKCLHTRNERFNMNGLKFKKNGSSDLNGSYIGSFPTGKSWSQINNEDTEVLT